MAALLGVHGILTILGIKKLTEFKIFGGKCNGMWDIQNR